MGRRLARLGEVGGDLRRGGERSERTPSTVGTSDGRRAVCALHLVG